MQNYPDYDTASCQVNEEVDTLLTIEDDNELALIMTDISEAQLRSKPWGETGRSFWHKVKQHLPAERQQ